MRLRSIRQGLAFVALVAAALVAGRTPIAAGTITMTVSGDITLKHPPGMQTLADEHTTIIPLPDGAYRVFAASNTLNSGPGRTGAVVLGSTDLMQFERVPGFGDPGNEGLVLSAPSSFTDCTFNGPSLFDQNYAAPGTVIHDPTQARGNMIMLYEAEQHCDGTTFNHNFYASIGFARSSDEGKTWPPPGSLSSAMRYPILQVAGPKPVMPGSANAGDALPSGFVDTVPQACRQGRPCPAVHILYVSYTNTGNPAATPPLKPDGYLRVARTQLGLPDPIAFAKWLNGGWTGQGLGGADSPVTSSKGCGTAAAQLMAQISYNDDLQLYLLTFVCVNVSNGVTTQGGWYFATATSLEQMNWTAPQLIANSQFPVPAGACSHGASFDGWYPSLISPGHKEGHTGLTGTVVFLSGCDGSLQGRQFRSRTFTISTRP
jgi:hypothetical protein